MRIVHEVQKHSTVLYKSRAKIKYKNPMHHYKNIGRHNIDYKFNLGVAKVLDKYTAISNPQKPQIVSLHCLSQNLTT